MEEKWQRWEEHSAKAKEEEEQRKLAAEQERHKRMEKREKIFRILQARDEERRRKAAEQNHQQAEHLKEEADMIEQTLKQKKEKEVQEWKSGFQKRTSAWEEKICNHHSSKSTSSRASLGGPGRGPRQVRFNSKPEIIPLVPGSKETDGNSINSLGHVQMEMTVVMDEDQIVVEDKVGSECGEECKDKAREEFAFNQKADEAVCKVLSKVFKEFVELKD